MTIEFIRHGLTTANAEKRYAGAMDSPVSEEGLRLAAQGRIDHALEEVFVTPLQRTQQTAAILFPNARQVILHEFREMNFGIFEGRTYQELEKDEAFIAWNADGGLQPMEGGEGRMAFGLRVRDALEQLVADAKKQDQSQVTLVCHGGVIMALMMVHALPEKPWRDWWVDNLQGYRVRLDPKTWGPEMKFLRYEALDFGVPGEHA